MMNNNDVILKHSVFRRIWNYFFQRKETDSSLRETLEELIERSPEDETLIDSDERELLGNILSLKNLTASDIMTPRADIIAVPHTIKEEDLINTFIKSGHSRLPVYYNNLDEVIKIIDIKDILLCYPFNENFSIKKISRDPLYVSPAISILDLIFQLRETGNKIALVVDEYGGVDGLVTLTDLIEEIIGNIQDVKGSFFIPRLIEKSNGSILADGRITLSQIKEALNIDMSLDKQQNDGIGTLAGLVVRLAGKVPTKNEIIKHPNGIRIKVLDSDPRRVKCVCLNLNDLKEEKSDISY